ncbi:hypothetical protein C5748_05150 [Phyllobacterium phragmitis]|uniref:3-keto-5-aminohexanoate cleavage enzyme n=2 Tax=Phyllobacterium phragmitis TaxID=2670329 RepID=A0A2S9IWN9_9HYPH|nr:hypothetical protein C5748_05150 [Phyllobacterium phragmitis]
MLQACLNGGRTRTFHPAVPLSPEEIAVDARAVVDAGAAELHIHPRDRDGFESLDPDDVAAALGAVRASVPGIPVGLSTGGWIRPGGRARQRQIENWTALPDYVSVNLEEEDAPEVIDLMLQKGVGVEAGLGSPADARRFVNLRLARQCLRVLIEIDEQDFKEGLAVANAIFAILDEASLTLPRLLHGSETTMWPFYHESIRRGVDARIGLEDGAMLPSSELAESNAVLIAEASKTASLSTTVSQAETG